MNSAKCEHILCAVRGRPESRETATRAIELALEHQARLTFVHVIDAEFLGPAGPTMSPLRAVYRQLRQMGEFAMLILCDRAKRRGVAEVEWVIQEGNVPKRLRQLIQESGADLLVIGHPARGRGKSTFTPEEFREFVAKVEQEDGLEVIEINPEKISNSEQ
ncbi:MAG: universal stress protein [Anaerolineales bacterium]|jgi:nucleotide-binding universal stress UspA family protein